MSLILNLCVTYLIVTNTFICMTPSKLDGYFLNICEPNKYFVGTNDSLSEISFCYSARHRLSMVPLQILMWNKHRHHALCKHYWRHLLEM